MTYLVTGATGRVGSRIVDRLLGDGHRVRALTRAPGAAALPRGVDVVAGDLTRPETLGAAFAGVTAAHLLTSAGDDHTSLETGPEIAKLAVDAGVRRVTLLAAGQDGPLERAVRASGLEWTEIRPIDYMGNALGWADSIRDHRAVREPYGGRLTASAHEADVASVFATLLVHGGHAAKTYRVTGPEALTPAAKVEAIAAATGLRVRFENLTDDQAREQWRAEGWPEEGIEFMLHMWATVPPVVGEVTDAVKEITGREPRDFAAWAAEHADAFR
ncbi:NAD(P)H-binding protein [Actinomadura sediminis]|uniref:NAD(P)H-binding protein n=1 Tax=Actinomadura sediminis TaxID=1038904 RepID=A0ABW3EJH7_9ACTN